MFPTLFSKQKKDDKGKFNIGSASTSISAKFAHHQMVDTLIQLLNKSDEQVYKMNYVGALGWLAYQGEKNRVQEAINKQKNR